MESTSRFIRLSVRRYATSSNLKPEAIAVDDAVAGLFNAWLVRQLALVFNHKHEAGFIRCQINLAK